MRSTTRSCEALALMISTTGYSEPSGKCTRTSSLPATTCRFVTIQPSSRTTKPVPSPDSVRIATIEGVARSAMSAGDSRAGCSEFAVSLSPALLVAPPQAPVASATNAAQQSMPSRTTLLR
jgi:hypothetical protein